MENPGYCQTCNKTFKGKRGLSQHNRRAHPVETHQRQALEIEQRDITLNNRRWTLGETREMSRLEANLLVINKSNIIISLQSSIKNRTYDAIKSHRRTADYKNLVSQLKNSLPPQPDNIAFTPTISNTPPSSPSPSHSPLNINAPTFIQLNNLEQNNIIDYILEINNTKNISLHEISYKNLVISSSISQNDIDRDYDYLLTNIDKIKIHRKQIQTLSTISTDRPITTETRTPTMCYSTIMNNGSIVNSRLAENNRPNIHQSTNKQLARNKTNQRYIGRTEKTLPNGRRTLYKTARQERRSARIAEYAKAQQLWKKSKANLMGKILNSTSL